MGTNIRLVSDIIEYHDLSSKSGILFMLDFTKAFDTIQWDFIFKTLNYFNFGPSFIRWIKTLYHNPEACIKNNGYMSDCFEISRGIRQGCPVSALIFVLCVEILAITIRNSTSLQGFCFGNEDNKIKISQYADDGILFLNNRNQFCSALNILETFGTFSGLKLNIEKCEGFWLGTDKDLQLNCNLFGIKWPEQFRCLGIYLGHNQKSNDMKNFDEKVDNIEDVLKKWKNRDLRLFGRIQIIKTFAISKLVLSASTQCVPEYIVKRIDRILYKFLWRSKDKVQRFKVIQDTKNGGLNMINIQAFFNSLLASWIKRILIADPNKDNWVQLPIYFLNVVDIEGLNLRYNFDNSVVFPEIAVIPKFYKIAFKCYNMAFASDKIYFESTIMNQSLRGNKFITHNVGCKKNVLFLRNWIRSGVRKVGDLTFTNGVLDERSVYHRIICKRNIHCEIMLVRKALSPYQQSLRVENNGALCTDKPMRSKDFYNVFRSQISERAGFTRISNYLASYCEPDEEIYAFSRIVSHEKEIKLKEFNFKVLHGILPCNRNLMRWKIRHDDKCDVCGQTQSIEHLFIVADT